MNSAGAHHPDSDGYDLVISRSIEEIERTRWNSVSRPDNPYHSWEFLRAVEHARSDTTRLYYLRFEHDSGGLLATAVLSVFETKLFGPRIRIAACGIPFPGGQHNFAIREGLDPKGIHVRIARELERLAEDNKAHLLLVKELIEEHLPAAEIYRHRGFLLAPSLPFHRFDVKWPTFESYCQSLKCKYRRDVRSALHAMGTETPELISSESYDKADDVPRFVVGGTEVCSPQEFYELYRNIAHRAKLQTFQHEPMKFFEELYRLPGITILAIKQRGMIHVAALLFQHDKNLIGVFVGKSEAPRDALYLYPNLIHGAIQLAIQRRCATLRLGQTTDEPKLRRGSIAEKRYFLIRARNPLINGLLHRFQSKLFKQPEIPHFETFRRDAPM